MFTCVVSKFLHPLLLQLSRNFARTNKSVSCVANISSLFFGRCYSSKCFVKPRVYTEVCKNAAKFNKTKKCFFRTTCQKNANPLFLLLLKAQGLKILKGTFILLSRGGRFLHKRLPLHLQDSLSRHKIVASVGIVIAVIILYYSYAHYDTCPLTGRKRWISFTREQILFLSDIDHEQLLKTHSSKMMSKVQPLYEMCNNLVKHLVERNSDIDLVKKIDWNLNVVYDDQINNVFVLPNGEIYLFTGMLQMMDSLEELAIVLGHEMAHAILGHVQEQQSFIVFGELLAVPILAFFWFIFDDFGALAASLVQNYLFPKVFQVIFNLPYSRQLETEADVVGYQLSSKACIDPRWGILLWDKLAFKEALDDFYNSNEMDVEFLSSHPSHEKRAATLEKQLPEMLLIQTKCNCPEISSAVDPLKRAHIVRKFATNIRERTALHNELTAIKSKSTLTEADVIGCAKLEKRFSHLTMEYEAMLQKENLQARLAHLSTTPNTKINNTVSKVTEKRVLFKHFVKPNKLSTLDSHVNKDASREFLPEKWKNDQATRYHYPPVLHRIDRRNTNRDYYSSIYF